MKKRILIIVICFLFQSIIKLNAQTNTNCNSAALLCSGISTSNQLGAGYSAESGPDYSCLYTQNSPLWFYLLVDQSGDLTINMSSLSGNDLDFTCWGPFNSLSVCSNLTAVNTVDCSYSTSFSEECNISNAVSGQYYLLMISNYSNIAGNVEIVQTNEGQPGAASTVCIDSICIIDSVSALCNGCILPNNLYEISGNIYLDTIPDSGSFTITEQVSGITQVINPPFTNPVNFIIDSIPYSTQNSVVNIFYSSTCQLTANITPPALAVLQGYSFNSDCGNSDGTAIVNISTGGIPDYSYQWSSGQFTINTSNMSDTVSNIPPGAYVVTVTNGNGCTSSASINVNDTNAFIATYINTTQPLCFGSCDGSITVLHNNTNSPFNYNWSNGQSHLGDTLLTDTVGNLCAGTYFVTVSDSHGCLVVATGSITDAPLIVLSAVPTSTHCNQSDGALDLTVTNGDPPFNYTWMPDSASTQDLINIPTGFYGVTVTDIKGCTATGNYNVPNVSGPIATISSFTDVSCFGLCDGIATGSVSGGTAPYTYLWSNGQFLQTATNLCSDIYSFTVTDAALCVSASTVSIAEPVILTVSVSSQTNVSCSELCDGTATIAVSGGTPGYAFLWCDGQINSNISGLCTGNCTVTVTDTNGCASVTNVTTLYDTMPPLQSGFNYTSNGLMFNFVNTSSQGSYSWNFGDSTTSTLENPVHSYVSDSTYLVCLTVYTLCDSAISCQNIIVTGENNVLVEKEEGINVFPNPAGDFINIEFKNLSELPVVVKFIDVIGKEAGTFILNNELTVVNVSNVPDGIYTLRFDNVNKQHIYRYVVIK